jgi:hypothetical protein
MLIDSASLEIATRTRWWSRSLTRAASFAGWGIGSDLRTDLKQFQDPEFHLREFLADLNQPLSRDRNYFGAGGGYDDALRDANLGEWEDIPEDMVLPEQPAGPLLKPLCVELRLVPHQRRVGLF